MAQNCSKVVNCEMLAEEISDVQDSDADADDEEVREVNEQLLKLLSIAIEQNGDSYRTELCKELYLFLLQ